MTTNSEMEEQETIDALVDFSMLIQRKGPKKVAFLLQQYYPNNFLKLRISMNEFPEKTVAALLKA